MNQNGYIPCSSEKFEIIYLKTHMTGIPVCALSVCTDGGPTLQIQKDVGTTSGK